MDFFLKPKLLSLSIIGLFLLNLATLGYLWFHRPPHEFFMERMGSLPEKRDFLENELKLNDKQRDDLQKMKEEHHKSADVIQDSIHALKDRMFDLISTTPPDTVKANEIARSIGEYQHRLEMVAFNHFRKVRDMLDDNQKKQFDKIIKNAMSMVGMMPDRERMMPPMEEGMHNHGTPPPRELQPRE